MCGRFTLRKPARELATFFDVAGIPDLSPRYNIAPTQNVEAVRMDAQNEQRELVLLHWGLIPSWAKDPSVGNRMVNARGESRLI
jgi:putative SOS response-associated peptidase YedK